jgi:hypothetical protein
MVLKAFSDQEPAMMVVVVALVLAVVVMAAGQSRIHNSTQQCPVTSTYRDSNK